MANLTNFLKRNELNVIRFIYIVAVIVLTALVVAGLQLQSEMLINAFLWALVGTLMSLGLVVAYLVNRDRQKEIHVYTSLVGH